MSDADLNKWIKELERDREVFNCWMWSGPGSLPSGRFADELAFLRSVDEIAMRQIVEDALATKIATREWPRDLTYEQYRYLWHRSFYAAGMIIPAAAASEALPSEILRLTDFELPGANDSAAMLRWLYLDIWNGSKWIRGLEERVVHESPKAACLSD